MKSILVLGLCLCVPSTVPLPLQCTGRPDGCDTPEEAIKLGRARIEAEKASHPFEGFERDDLKEAVLHACAFANRTRPHDFVHDEHSLCLRRGRRTAEHLMRFSTVKSHKKYTKNDVIKLRSEFSTQPSLGTWYRIEDGVVVGQSAIGQTTGGEAATDHMGAFIAYCASLGTFAGTTFEFVATVGDGCLGDPLMMSVRGSPEEALEQRLMYFPITSYSKAEECDHHVVVPTTPWLHSYHNPPSPAWKDLKETAIFRGDLNTPLRGLLAFVSHLKLVEDMDFKIQANKCDGPCKVFYKKYRDVDYLKEMKGVDEVCKPDTEGGVCATSPVKHPLHKAIIVTDGIGAVTRFPAYFSAPGLNVEIKSKYEMYFSKDVLPFVHYVGVTSEIPLLPEGLNLGLKWIRGNDAEAQAMSLAATAFSDTHLTYRSRALTMRVFANLMDALWDDSVPPAVSKANSNAWASEYKGTAETGVNCDTWKTWWAKRNPERASGMTHPYREGCMSVAGTERVAPLNATRRTPAPVTTEAPRTLVPYKMVRQGEEHMIVSVVRPSWGWMQITILVLIGIFFVKYVRPRAG